MIFTRAEIDVLRLADWCKDLPAAGIDILPGETIRLLLALGLLRQSRCGLSYRPTPAGYSLLREAGFAYAADKQYRGAGPTLTRRLGTASVVSFLWRYGADVFRVSPGAEPGVPAPCAVRRGQMYWAAPGWQDSSIQKTRPLSRIISPRKAKGCMPT